MPSELFCNIKTKAKDNDNLNEMLATIFSNIEASAKGTQSEKSFAGLFEDIDVNSNKLGTNVLKRNERLIKLISGVANMELGDYKNNTIDAFGDA